MTFEDQANLINLAESLPAALRKSLTRFAEIHAKITALEEAGITEATTYYRQAGTKRYLYLIHPTKDGTRQREYIGPDPEKQAAALARLDRWEQYQQLTAKARDLGSSISYFEANLRQLLRNLK